MKGGITAALQGFFEAENNIGKRRIRKKNAGR